MKVLRGTVLPLLIVVSCLCSAQSGLQQIEEVHQEGLRNNPAGIDFTIGVVDNERAEYQLGRYIRLKLSFSSTKLRTYTAELERGNNVSAVSDEFVFQAEDGFAQVVALPNKQGIVCCGGRRVYLTKDIVAGETLFPLSPRLFERRPLFGDEASGSKEPLLHPGKYKIFVRTRRVLRGEPKPSQQNYETSEFQVTSSNILEITILPRPPAPSTPMR